MTCPACGAACIHWVDSSIYQYGWGCLTCVKYWTQSRDDSSPTGFGDWVSEPLDMVPLPRRLERIPAVRRAVGWVGK